MSAAIKLLREEAGWSQEKLALEIGVSPSEISHIESGRRNSTWGTVARVAGGLDLRVSDIAKMAERLEDGEDVN